MAHWGQFTERFIADTNPSRQKRVHDLENEKDSCAINFIEWSGNARAFTTAQKAVEAGYAPCIFCMPREENAG
jgi:hypothetical protein